MFPRVENFTEPRWKEHLGVLDGVRGVAISLVFIFHALSAGLGLDAPAWSGWHRAWPLPWTFWALLPAYLGWAGVAMFFVVSGFCIHLSHRRSGEEGFRNFFLRRFFRIYPPYLAALLFFALLFPVSRLAFSTRHDLSQLLTHLLLLHNDLGPGFIYGINPALWSIGVEVQLYLLYPLLLWLVGKTGWSRALGLACGVEVMLRFRYGLWNPNAPGRLWLLGDPLMYGFSWALGARLAEGWLQGEALPWTRFPGWLWPTFAIGSYFIAPFYAFGFLLWALATAVILARLLSPGRSASRAFWNNARLRKIGLVSYSLYLLHQPLEEWVGRNLHHAIGNSLPSEWMSLAGCLAVFPVVLLISWGFYRWVEQPSIALGKWVIVYKI